ncbi:hypothetical protein HN747_01700 [archaeon]|jgi:RNA-binding protein YhbY|nr:hypothetical protein [archaeon]
MRLSPIKRLQIGKNGLTPEFIDQVKVLFVKQKILKINILKSACRDKAEAEKMADELIEALGRKYKYKLVGYVITLLQFRKNQR